MSVDPGTVGRAQILHPKVAIGLRELGVLARGSGIADQAHISLPSDDQRGVAEGDFDPLFLANQASGTTGSIRKNHRLGWRC